MTVGGTSSGASCGTTTYSDGNYVAMVSYNAASSYAGA